MQDTKRILYIILGTLFFILGYIGIFVPLLPTTPFWLLTCWFYIRSSKRLYDKVMSNRYFGPYIKDFVEDKSITLKTKIISLSIMWLSAILTSVFIINSWWVRGVLLFISAGVTWHILSFCTKKRHNNP